MSIIYKVAIITPSMETKGCYTLHKWVFGAAQCKNEPEGLYESVIGSFECCNKAEDSFVMGIKKLEPIMAH